MTNQIEIVGIGDTDVHPDGKAVTFVLETRQSGPQKILCTAKGLEMLIGSLTALLQAAIGRSLRQSESEKQSETIPIQQVGCGKATNSLEVILSPSLPSGSMLNLALSPELAKNLGTQLLAFASEQLSRKN